MVETHNNNANVFTKTSDDEMDREILRKLIERAGIRKPAKTKSSKGKFPSNLQPKKKKRK